MSIRVNAFLTTRSSSVSNNLSNDVKRQQRAEDKIGERAQRLLKMLVEHYLAQGTPVASKTLATQPGIDVSPATVRSIMAELEARGLVVSPHTSAGKIPTNLGLRFFVDTLLSVQPLGRSSVQMLRDGLNPDLAPSRLVELASGLLAEISSMAGVVTLPRKEQVLLRQVEFLPLTANRVLVILVINERDVQNRVIHTDREYSESELVQAANYINREFAGSSLLNIRTALVESMQADKANRGPHDADDARHGDQGVRCRTPTESTQTGTSSPAKRIC